MPINIRADLVELTQGEFSSVSYEVMSKAFAVHKELGNLFDESVYRNALADRLNDVLTEVQIDVSRKTVTFKTLHISVPHISEA